MLLLPNRLARRSAHARFRSEALASAERVRWAFPTPSSIEHRRLTVAELKTLHDEEPNHPAVREVARLFAFYRASLLEALTQHERRYNRGSMPQVTIVRERRVSCELEAFAQFVFATAWHDTIVDATEETELLHPDADVARVVSIPTAPGGGGAERGEFQDCGETVRASSSPDHVFEPGFDDAADEPPAAVDPYV